MRSILAALGAALLLTACGATAQEVQPQQVDSITVSLVETEADCHIEADATDKTVEFSTSEGCGLRVAIPFSIDAAWGAVYDGGAPPGAASSVWFVRPGTFEIVAADGDSLGIIEVPE